LWANSDPIVVIRDRFLVSSPGLVDVALRTFAIGAFVVPELLGIS
jgi:hypothetical protein